MLTQTSLKFVARGLINYKPALRQIIAWRQIIAVMALQTITLSVIKVFSRTCSKIPAFWDPTFFKRQRKSDDWTYPKVIFLLGLSVIYLPPSDILRQMFSSPLVQVKVATLNHANGLIATTPLDLSIANQQVSLWTFLYRPVSTIVWLHS